MLRLQGTKQYIRESSIRLKYNLGGKGKRKQEKRRRNLKGKDEHDLENRTKGKKEMLGIH